MCAYVGVSMCVPQQMAVRTRSIDHTPIIIQSLEWEIKSLSSLKTPAGPSQPRGVVLPALTKVNGVHQH